MHPLRYPSYLAMPLAEHTIQYQPKKYILIPFVVSLGFTPCHTLRERTVRAAPQPSPAPRRLSRVLHFLAPVWVGQRAWSQSDVLWLLHFPA